MQPTVDRRPRSAPEVAARSSLAFKRSVVGENGLWVKVGRTKPHARVESHFPQVLDGPDIVCGVHSNIAGSGMA